MTSAPPAGVLRRCLNRATFGVTPALLEEVAAKGWERWVEEQSAPDEAADGECARRIRSFRLAIEYEFDPPKKEGVKEKEQTAGRRKVKEKRSLGVLEQPIEKTFGVYNNDSVPYEEKNRGAEELVMATMLRAVYSRWQLREVLADFWHNHFNVSAEKDEAVALALPTYDREVVRAHLFGNFREFLEAVARSTAMLYYLDGVESRASPANENFARELFELHTLGAQHYLNHLHTKWREVPGALDGQPEGYIDQDVYEASRAFTGWTVENGNEDEEGAKRPVTGKFLIREGWHDPYQKRVLATEFDSQRPALEDGRRVLDLVAQHPATARFIAEKLCRRLLSDDPPETLVSRAAAEFAAHRDSPDQLARVTKLILLRAEFRDAPARKFKRPLEFLASYLRVVGADFTPRREVAERLGEMGQHLFRWTTPQGHPDRTAYWTGGTFLLRRWNLPLELRENDDWKGIASFRFVTQTPPACRTIGEVLEHWSERLLGEKVSGEAAAALLRVLADDDDATANTEFSGGDRERDERIAACVAVLAASPQFQYR